MHSRSDTSLPDTRLLLGYSRALAIISSAVLIGSMGIILSLPLWWGIKIALLMGLIVYYHFFLNRHVSRRSKDAICAVSQKLDGRWVFSKNNGLTMMGTLLSDSFKSPYFLVLHLRLKAGTRYVFIPKDALSVKEYNALYQKLK